MKASRVLLIIVCLLTSFIFTVLYVYKYVYQKDIVPSAKSATYTLAEADNADSTPTLTDPTPTAAVVSRSVLPRLSYAYDGVTVGVTGSTAEETMLDYFAFGGYIFVIVGTDAADQDFYAEHPSLAVARFDDACTLSETLVLPKSDGYAYLAAALYDYGIVIAATSGADVRLWSVSTNMTVRTTTYPYVVSTARMLYAQGKDVLCALGDKLHVLAVDADLKTAWYHAIPADGQRVVDVYLYNDCYLALCTGANGGFAYCFDAASYRSRAVLPAITAVTPYLGGYAIASLAEGKLFTFDYQFARTGEQSLPRASSVRLCSYDKGILLLLDAKGYLLCNHGDVQYTFDAPCDIVSTPLFTGGRFYFATFSSGAATIYAYTPFDTAACEVAVYLGATSPTCWVSNGNAYCLCTSTFDYGYFSGSIGGKDVYLLRASLPSR
jgi:hypothetical protein